MSFFKKKEPEDSEEYTVIFELDPQPSSSRFIGVSSIKIRIGGMSSIVLRLGESKEVMLTKGKHTIAFSNGYGMEIFRKKIQEDTRCVIHMGDQLEFDWYEGGINNYSNGGPTINLVTDDSFYEDDPVSEDLPVAEDNPVLQPIRMTFLVRSNSSNSSSVDIRVDGRIIARLRPDEKAGHFLAKGFHEFKFNDKAVSRSVDKSQMCIITIDNGITFEFLESDCLL